MATEHAFGGAKNAFIFYGAYLNTVAQEMGMERALALHTKMLETAGAMQGKTMKERTGMEEVDAKAAWSLVRAVPESLGISFEVVEESPSRVRIRYGQCSVCEGWHMGGLDDKTRETMCRVGSMRFMDTAVKQLNPRLSYQLTKYRSALNDFCEEQIVLG